MKIVSSKWDHLTDEQLINGEWLVTNGIGGFACGSICGTLMRRYHSLLNAALPNPYGRTIMLNYASDLLVLPNKEEIRLSCLKMLDDELKSNCKIEFRLDNGLPVWLYQFGEYLIEKRLHLVHRQNTLHMSYRLISEHENVELRWTPFFHFRTNEQLVNVVIPNESYTVHAKDFEYEVECPGFPLLRLCTSTEASFTLNSQVFNKIHYAIEAARGYESYGSLTSPGYFQLKLRQNEWNTFIVSTEPWDTIHAIPSRQGWAIEKMRKQSLLKMAGVIGKETPTAKLVLASDHFIITPTTRFLDMIRLQALGEESKTVIAGYPWFTDWGRDTMISFEGLTLTTGRHREAYSILQTFAHYILNGLIPNMFPDGENKGIYNTADATLWFFHAIDRYISTTNDIDILDFLLPNLKDIIQHHINGTQFGIRMDRDGLLIQGQQGVQLTWMDAKVGDWVVTPRRGKAVEINALWYNALKLYEKWTDTTPELSQQCYESFNKKFWFGEGGYLYDVIEGEGANDSSLRPNQLFAISLPHPVLEPSRWKSVLDNVQKNLYTPVGLRTLSPFHPDYKSNYDGDLRSRDAAYHQGTVWPWLIGPYVDSWLKVYPGDYQGARDILKGLVEHLNNNCIGSIEEIFDAIPPYKPRGCFAQAWSVAELLRCLAKVQTELEATKQPQNV